MRRALILLLLVAQFACRREKKPDAYGNVEATEVVVAAESRPLKAPSPRNQHHRGPIGRLTRALPAFRG